jgi:hypothetical protein
MRECDRARRYVRGELGAGEAAAFERRLGEDPAAQEALCEAVRREAARAGRRPPRPNPAYRAGVRRRLLPGRDRGLRAALWAAAGAAAAAALILLAPRPTAPPPAAPAALAGQVPAPPADRAAAGPNVSGGAAARADLPAGARDDENRRLVRGEGAAPSPLKPPPPMEP